MKNDTINSVNLDDFLEVFKNSLVLEKIIKLKKENNIKLTTEEYFFDMYMISPSKLLKLFEEVKKNE